MWPTPNIPVVFHPTTDADWLSWHWQLQHATKSGTDLARLGLISHERAATIDRLEAMRLTPYLISLIDWNNPNDPIALQHLPHQNENNSDTFSFHTIWERANDFVDGDNRLIQQKYPDVVLLRLSNTCHAYCRFCFQKERTLRGDVATDASDKLFLLALEHIKKQPRVRQVLISGGDPFILSDDLLLKRLEQLSALPNVTTIRINTRSLLHNPYRLTVEFIAALGEWQRNTWQTSARGKELHLGLHFNHPKELTPEAIHVMRQLKRAGIALYNQTVLLRGVNDSSATLAELFRRLLAEGVRLHYLSQTMAVPGTSHMRTRVRRGQEIMRELRQHTEFRGALPHFELSHYTGKHMIPDTMNEFFYEDTIQENEKRIPVIRFVSDVTHQWEIFPDGT